MKRSWQIYLTAVGLVTGIVYSQYYIFTLGWAWLGLAVLSIILLVLTKTKLSYVAFLVLAFILGAWRLTMVTTPTHPHIDDYHFRKVIIAGIVSGTPFWNEKREFQYYLNDLTVDGQSIAGQMRVKSQIGNACEGCMMAVSGKVWPGFGKTTAQMSYAKPVVLSQDISIAVKIKKTFNDGLRVTLGQTEAAFVEGILIGARTQLPKKIQDDFSTAGLSHVVAVSGYNLTIILTMLALWLRRRWLWGGFVLSLGLIGGFMILTGAGAPIMRAGVMAGVFLLGAYVGRPVKVEVCLALGLIITLMISPTQLISDLSWQLSFLSLAGIVFLSPKLMMLMPKRGSLGVIFEILAVTLAAQLATLPLIALVFGRISVIAPLANLIIMPLIPPLMLLGFVSGLIGMLSWQLASIMGGIINFIISQVLELISWLASLSWAQMVLSISIYQMLTIYASLALLALARQSKHSTNNVLSGIIGSESKGNYVRT